MQYKRKKDLAKRLTCPRGFLHSGYTPIVLILSISIKQRINLLLSLPPRDGIGIGHLEQIGSHFSKPLGFNGSHLSHV